MDAELLELQKQFEFAQQAKSSIRLSERNVVELVQKLQELHILDFDLLHTVSGKEYITPDQLRSEIAAEIKKLGRVSVIDLADIIGVDFYHVEKQAQCVVSDDPRLMLIQGEIISQSYWDGVAEEINEWLQECSQIALADIAGQLNVGSEYVASMLDARIGTLVKGRLEGGQLYTPAYVACVSAMVRGAARGITVPMNLSALWATLQHLLQEMNGATGVTTESSFFQSQFNGVVKDGEVLGSLRAGVHWTPTVFAIAQRECVDSFFSQNSCITYDALHKLGISQPVQFLQSRYPEGIPLADTFVHPSMIEMLDAAVEDAVDRGSWIDSLSVLPSSFGSQDASKILPLCPSVQSALKSGKGLVMGDSYVFSNGFIKDVYNRMEKDIEAFTRSGSSIMTLSDNVHLVKESKIRTDSSKSSESNESGNERKKKKGKSSGSKVAESLPDDEDYVPTKSKKNPRKGKDASSAKVSDAKTGAKKIQEDNLNVPSEEWVMEKILALVPDFEEQGLEDIQTVLRPLANHIRPMLINSLKEKRKTLLTENADKIRRVLDNLQKKLDESFLNMQLYEKALELFEDDQSTSAILHRHLLRTVAAPIADMLLRNLDTHNKLKNGIEVEEAQNPESITLASVERTAIAKGFPGSLSKKALAVVEALEGKRVEAFMTSLREMAEDSGLLLKKLDKKLERTLLHSYRKDLTAQVSAETDPVTLLPKVVSLLYLQIHNKALQAPGRAISIAVSRLKDKLDESAHKILTDYHAATVTLLSLVSASTGDVMDKYRRIHGQQGSFPWHYYEFVCQGVLYQSIWIEEDCTSDRILTKREQVENLMPTLKGLVLSALQS